MVFCQLIIQTLLTGFHQYTLTCDKESVSCLDIYLTFDISGGQLDKESVSCLDIYLTFDINGRQLSTRLYDKIDDFNFNISIPSS